MKYLKFTLSFYIILAIVFCFNLTCFAENTTYVWSNNTSSVETSGKDIKDNSLQLESPSAILIEQSTGQVLYSHNVHEKLRPASVTKVMSILLIMEQIDSRKTFFNRYHKLF